MANVTVDDVFESDENVDFHYRLNTPKLSSNLLIMANSVYNHTRAAIGFENYGKPLYEKNAFGISSIRIWGTIEAGNLG